MSNPEIPVKVSSTPTGAAAAAAGPVLPPPPPEVPIPSPPTYDFPDYQASQATFRILSANFVIGAQTINVQRYLKEQISYGYLEYPVQTLYNTLNEKKMIAADVDPTSANLSPPALTITYIDDEGFKSQTYKLADTIVLGQLSMAGQFMKKPGQLSWAAALIAGRVQFWAGIFIFWVLMVVWAYKMWSHMSSMNLTWKTATVDEFGDYGYVFAKVAGGLIQVMMGAAPYVMAFIAALAPVWSFFIQFVLWFFVDSQLDHKLAGPGPAPAPEDAAPKMGMMDMYKAWRGSKTGTAPPPK